MSGTTSGSIQSVDRAMRILNLFSPRNPQWAVGDIARTLQLSKSVVSRLLATMAREGFVVQDQVSKRYAVGPQAFAVGSSYQPYMVLDAILRPVMEELSEQAGQSTSAGIPSGNVFTIISTIQSRNQVRVAFDVGQRPYYHSAAIGKLLLSTMTEAEVRAIVGPDPLPQETPCSITSYAELAKELETIHATGVAISTQESILGVGAIAAGIHNSTGECVGGISVVYPVHMVTETDIAEYSRLTIEAARKTSSRLGTLSLRHVPSEHALFTTG